MRFDGHVLVKIGSTVATPQWLDRVSPTPRISLEEAANPRGKISYVIDVWTEEFGRDWIDHFANAETTVTCQEGDLVLPVDTWHCKITGDMCPLQAQIPLDDKEQFFQGCNIEKAPDEINDSPQEYKEKLWDTVQREQFTGEHHKASRYACVRCQQKGKHEYLHFPWALTRLADHLEYDKARADHDFVRANLATQLAWPICAECFLVLPDDAPPIDFESYGLDFKSYRAVEYVLDYS